MNRKIEFTLNGQRVTIEANLIDKQPTANKRETVHLNPINFAYPVLSIVGMTSGGAGQIVDTLEAMNDDVQDDDVTALVEMWRDYHLNDLNAGTLAQQKIVDGANYDMARQLLEQEGLFVDRGYAYGSAWLVHILPRDIEERLTEVLDALDGADLGEAPDLDSLPDIEGEDIIDTRDLIERLDGYKAFVKSLGLDPETVEKDTFEESEQWSMGTIDAINHLVDLREFASECESYAADYLHGETLIAESHFQEYAERLADDIGAVNSDATWPNNHIDWEAAANELKGDYTAIEFKGVTYFIR